MRDKRKLCNFGIVYGISDYGLSQNLGITRKAAAEFIEKYLESFPGVQEYMDDIVKPRCETKGYVATLLNRRRTVTFRKLRVVILTCVALLSVQL